MSTGQRSESNATFLTDRVLHRTVSAVDASGVDDVALPVINLHLDETAAVRREGSHRYGDTGPTYNGPAWTGHNAYLALFVMPAAGVTSITLQVYTWGGVDPAPPVRAGLTGDWCLVETKAFTSGNELWTLRNLPATPVRVVVSALAGAGATRIVEQHSI